MDGAVLPDYTEAYQSLSRQGAQFPEDHRQISVVSGITYQHPQRGTQPVELDAFALRATERIYTTDLALAVVCARRGVPASRLDRVVPLITDSYGSGRLVWGFSGYSTPGYSYGVEANSLRALFAYLHHFGKLPSLVVDGGVSDGVLGLSGILADRFQVPSLGYIPLQGLSSFGPRTHLVAHKDTYSEREILVGLTPDVLVCVGGGLGTQRECEAALTYGGVVLLLALRDYGPDSLPSVYLEHPTTRIAARDGRLVVCSNVRDVQERMPRIIQTARRVSLQSRSRRLEELRRQLT